MGEEHVIVTDVEAHGQKWKKTAGMEGTEEEESTQSKEMR